MGKLEKRFPIYSKILALYPDPYRHKYNQEMMQVLADMLDDPNNSKLTTWTRTAADLPLSLVKQNMVYASGVMKNETPAYVKRNAIFSAALLLPFFFVVISNATDSHFTSRIAWQNTIWFTLITAPIIAFLLSLGTFLKWTRDRKVPIWRSLFDIRRGWLTLGIGALALVIALFVPFHDSVHCITADTPQAATHLRQTWACVWQGN